MYTVLRNSNKLNKQINVLIYDSRRKKMWKMWSDK